MKTAPTRQYQDDQLVLMFPHSRRRAKHMSHVISKNGTVLHGHKCSAHVRHALADTRKTQRQRSLGTNRQNSPTAYNVALPLSSSIATTMLSYHASASTSLTSHTTLSGITFHSGSSISQEHANKTTIYTTHCVAKATTPRGAQKKSRNTSS